jgi:hypothetical protein
MKAIVKATGKIVELADSCYLNDKDFQHSYYAEELEGIENSLDYWTRLEHQYAGMAMQGMVRTIGHDRMYPPEKIAIYAEACAHALVEKMKEERK